MKLFKGVIAFIVALAVIFPATTSTSKAAEIISVSEAITNNTGIKTVEGYIVAHTITNKSYKFSGPFQDNYNFAIADSPNEKDATKILPVQLTSSYRAQFGLQTNPDNIGKKVVITGSLESYFSSPGLKSPSKITFIDDSKAKAATPSITPGVINSGTVVSLTTPTENATIYYTLDGTNPTTDSEIYHSPIELTASTTITTIVTAPDLLPSTIAAFTYQVARTDLRIHDIQGISHYSPYANEYVGNVEGIVTFVDDTNNFYMQDLQPDNNDLTSEGILIYKRNHGVQVGDVVSVSGQIKEWVLEGYAEKLETDLPVTEINASNITTLKTNQPLPKPVKINKDRKQPTKVIDNDQFGLFDPREDGIDYYESLEGMLVEIAKPKIIAPQNYGELYIAEKSIKTNTKAGGLTISNKDYNPERIILDINDSSYVAKTGDYFSANITGVVSYGYSNFKVIAKKETLPTLIDGKTKQETTKLKGSKKELTVATYNVENFSAKTNNEKIERIAKGIVSNLSTPDIIGLTEIQDNDGATNSGNTDASESYETLINKVIELGGPAYSYTDIAPENNEDGGAPGGNIRVGFLYNEQRVTLGNGTKGTATEAVTYEKGKLSLNPGRIDPTNTAFEDSRKPLAGQFYFNGKSYIVIVNHFNSKGGDQPLFGKNQAPVLSSEAQRNNIATVVNSFVKDIQKKNKKENIIVLGDFNDFEFSTPLSLLKGKELTNMTDKVAKHDRYTYKYQGNSQVLDHILVSKNLAKKTKVDIVHINTPFMVEHGRASDHDPVIIQVK